MGPSYPSANRLKVIIAVARGSLEIIKKLKRGLKSKSSTNPSSELRLPREALKLFPCEVEAKH